MLDIMLRAAEMATKFVPVSHVSAQMPNNSYTVMRQASSGILNSSGEAKTFGRKM